MPIVSKSNHLQTSPHPKVTFTPNLSCAAVESILRFLCLGVVLVHRAQLFPARAAHYVCHVLGGNYLRTGL